MAQEEISSTSPFFLKKNSPHLPFCAAWSIETEVPVSNLESALSNYLVIASLSHLIDAEIKGPDPSKWKYSHKNRKHVGEPSLKWGKWNICRRAAWLSDNNIWSRMQYQYFCGSNWLTTICSSKLERKMYIQGVFNCFFFSITQPAKSFFTWKNSSKSMSVWLQLIFHSNPEKRQD